MHMFCAHVTLNGLSDLEVKDETPFSYVHAEIRTQVIVICDPTPYQLDHGGAIPRVWNELPKYIKLAPSKEIFKTHLFKCFKSVFLEERLRGTKVD